MTSEQADTSEKQADFPILIIMSHSSVTNQTNFKAETTELKPTCVWWTTKQMKLFWQLITDNYGKILIRNNNWSKKTNSWPRIRRRDIEILDLEEVWTKWPYLQLINHNKLRATYIDLFSRGCLHIMTWRNLVRLQAIPNTGRLSNKKTMLLN